MGTARWMRVLAVLTLGATAALVGAGGSPGFASGPSVLLTPNGASETVGFSTGGETATATLMGRAGQQLSIATSKGTFAAKCDVHMTLRAPDNSVVAGPTCAAKHARVSVGSLPVDGSYSVTLAAGPSATGSLTIAAKSSGGPRSITPGAAPIKISWPTPTNQQIDLFFTAHAGDIFSAVSTGGQGNDPCLLMMGFFDSLNNPQGRLPICAAGGGYVLRIGTGDGTYRLRLEGYDPKPLFVQLFLDVDQVVAITTDGTPGSFNTPTPGQDAVFTFPVTAGQQVSAVLSSTWVDRTAMLLRDPEGSEVMANLVQGFLVSDPVTETGTWTLVLDRNNPEPDAGTLRVDTFNDITAPADLSGAPHNLNLVPGQTATYSFSGTPGQKVSALLTKIKPGPCGALQPLLTLVRPDNSQAAGSACVSKTKFLDATTLDTAGTWKVIVDPPGAVAFNATLQSFDVVDETGTVPTNGTPTPITISEPGQNSVRSFTLTKAHTMITAAITGASAPTCTLRILDGATVVGLAPCSVGSATVGPLSLPAGTYDVVFDPEGPSTGSATLTVSKG